MHKSHVLFGMISAYALVAYAEPQVPAGFVSLFNGKDLEGWCGGELFDPQVLAEMPAEERAAKVQKWTEDMQKHWKVENGELVNDGNGAYATTSKNYGDFELLLEYKTVPKADSGVFLRGVPQVQIWDHTDPDGGKLGRSKGSGGLWNNPEGSPGRDPLVLADKPFGEWNKLRIVMVGSRVSVWLNGKQTVDHAILHNFFDKKRKEAPANAVLKPVPKMGPIQLQTHGGEIRWKNLLIREIAGEEANQILGEHKDKGDWKTLFNGKDLSDWAGDTDNYEVKDGAIVCKTGKGGTVYAVGEVDDFKARVQFRLPPGGNNGLAIRYPGKGDTAYVGMCELQVLDDTAPQYAKLDPRQYHGSIYGIVPACRGYLRPVGEWNFEEVTVKGSRIRVELNGTVIVDADVAAVTEYAGNKQHPGKMRTSGFFGFAGHDDPVAFRGIELLPLK